MNKYFRNLYKCLITHFLVVNTSVVVDIYLIHTSVTDRSSNVQENKIPKFQNNVK